MSTKIDGMSERPTAPLARPSATKAADGAQRSQAAAASSPTARGDALSLTEAAQLLQEAQASAREAPAVDQHRVDQVRQSLRDGSYRIDSEAIAARLLRTEWELTKP